MKILRTTKDFMTANATIGLIVAIQVTLASGQAQSTMAESASAGLPAERCKSDISSITGNDPKNLLEQLKALSEGERPNLSDPNQLALFEIYRIQFLGDPTTQLNSDTTGKLVETMKAHPEITKIPLQSQRVLFQAPLPLSDNIGKTVQQVRTNAQISNGKLYKIEANSGLWNKVFENLSTLKNDNSSLKDKLVDGVRGLTGQRWKSYIPENVEASLNSEETLPLEKAKILFNLLNKIRENTISVRGANAPELRPLNQVMADIVHGAGFLNRDLVNLLKVDDGRVVVEAFESLLGARDELAKELGYAHYNDLLMKLSVKGPSGLPVPNIKFIETWNQQKQKNLDDWQNLTDSNEFTVRQLSPEEAVFRSCLGGNECSSRTYGLKALDTNYQYFTMTDSEGRSIGNMTVVLGQGKINGSEKRVAFLDKIQNVPVNRLSAMLEGVRRSLEAADYLLAAPKEMGDHSGLSNSTDVRTFFAHYVRQDDSQMVTSFTPHPTSLKFENKYSRAEMNLGLFPIEPLNLGKLTLEPVGLAPFRAMSAVDARQIILKSYELKNGSEHDKIVYLKTQEALAPLGFTDPEFNAVTKTWLSQNNLSFSIKKQIILASPTENIFSLAEANLSEPEQQRFFTSLISSNFYRKKIGLDRIYGFLNTHPDYLKQISSKNFSGFSLHRLLGMKADNVLVAAVNSKAAKLEKKHDASGSTALGRAAAEGNLVVLKALLENGASANPTDNSGRTPLVRATVNKETGAAEMLLKSGRELNVNEADSDQHSALWYAIKNNQTSIVPLLLEKGAQTSFVNIYGQLDSTALYQAVDRGRSEIAEILISHGADVNLPSANGLTPLMKAAQNGDPTMVHLLLSHGALKSVTSPNNHTAAHFAKKNGHLELVPLLK